MPAMPESFGLAQLGGTQAFGSSRQVSLFQRLSNHAPAERSPRDAFGSLAR